MAQQIINVGTLPNDGTGDPLRTSQQKANANFTELYALVNSGGITLKTVGGQSLLGAGNVTEVQNSLTASTILAPSVDAVNTGLASKIGLTSLSASTPLSYNNLTGAFSIQQANTSQSGFLSSTDWNTFNGKQNVLTNPVTGTGTVGQVAFWNGTSVQSGDNQLFWDNTAKAFGIGTNTVSYSKQTLKGTLANDTTSEGLMFYLPDAVQTGVFGSKQGFFISQTNTGGLNGKYTIGVGDSGSRTFDLGISVNGAERILVKRAGRVLFNTTTDNLTDLVQVNGSASSTNFNTKATSYAGTFTGSTNIDLGSHNDYENSVILLHEIYNGTIIDRNFVNGEVLAHRGSTGAILAIGVFKVNTSTGYNSTWVNMNSIASSSGATQLWTCVYGGKKYICLRFTEVQARGFSFSGTYRNGSGGEILKLIKYRNSQTSTVLDAEIDSSLSLYTTPASNYFYGNVVSTNSDAKVLGGDSAGRLIVGNISQTSYIEFDGSTYTTPNELSLVTTSGSINLFTNAISRIKVVNAGRVLFGTTTDNLTDLVQVNGSAIATAWKVSGGLVTQYQTGTGTLVDFETSVRGSLLTGYVSGAGTISATDTVLQAIQKLNGNDQLRENAITAGTTAQYWRGDKTFQTLNTTAVAEGTNLYFTNARVLSSVLTGYTAGSNTALAATDTLLAAMGKIQGQITARENTITAGTTLQYYRGDKTWQTLNTAAVAELTNLYYTNARGIGSVLTGYVSGAGTIAATDTILQAIQKLNGNDVLKAPLASPAFTGVPTAPTATAGDNTTQIATTAFVLANSLPNNGLIEYNLGDRTLWNNGKGDIDSNTSFGIQALRLNTTGIANTAIGSEALTSNTIGGGNTSTGSRALQSNVDGANNSAVGIETLRYSVSGSNNTAIGAIAGAFFTGSGSLTTVSQGVFVGSYTVALANNSINEIVIGCNTVGAGSNTATLGNTNITKTVLRGVVQMQGYTVATLPTGAVGMTAYVTNALAPTPLATVVGGGAVVVRVFHNGTNWIVQ
jgi:hypothetical protein